MLYLATECLINCLYSKMCNFNIIIYCKDIVLFQSHLCTFIVIVAINCVNVNVNVT